MIPLLTGEKQRLRVFLAFGGVLLGSLATALFQDQFDSFYSHVRSAFSFTLQDTAFLYPCSCLYPFVCCVNYRLQLSIGHHIIGNVPAYCRDSSMNFLHLAIFKEAKLGD